MKKLNLDFFLNDSVYVAKNLIGKYLVLKDKNGNINKYQITETESYGDELDTASHARFGRTKRNEVMYMQGGTIYIYLIYGIYYLMNIVTGNINEPEGVLIRGIKEYNGPGRLTKNLGIDKRYNKKSILGDEIWIEDDGKVYNYNQKPRVGINYATEPYKSIEWRFILK